MVRASQSPPIRTRPRARRSAVPPAGADTSGAYSSAAGRPRSCDRRLCRLGGEGLYPWWCGNAARLGRPGAPARRIEEYLGLPQRHLGEALAARLFTAQKFGAIIMIPRRPNSRSIARGQGHLACARCGDKSARASDRGWRAARANGGRSSKKHR